MGEAAVELSAEEKKVWFRKSDTEDLNKKDLGYYFSMFSIPTKEEGFDEVRYIWQSEEACKTYLQNWIIERKMLMRVEDLNPGQWFKEQWNSWGRLLDDWKRRHGAWKDPSARRAAAERRRREKEYKEKKNEKEKEVKDDEKEAEAKADKAGEGEGSQEGQKEEQAAKEPDGQEEKKEDG